MKLHEFPRHPLTFGPSPVHRLARLSEHLGGAEVWAKREDVNSGLAYGGNKLRKLEYIVPDVLASGADTLVSIGGIQSNHTRQVAAVAAHLGLKARLVQEKWVPWADPVNDKVGNILLSRMMGADVRLDPSGFDIGIRKSWEDALREVEEAGGTPYPIPAGASVHPLGGLGFANWAFEVAEQEKALGVHLRHHRRLHGHGLHARRDDRRLRRARAADRRTAPRAGHRRLGHAGPDHRPGDPDRAAHRRAHRARPGPARRRDQVLEGWAGDVYGIPVDSTMEAMRLGAELEAMITDPVYEGKSLAGLIDLVRGGDIPRDSTVLYAHLGGQPALNAYHALWS